MEVFVYLFGYIILFCIIVAYTKRIKPRKKKYIVTIVIFLTSHFILVFEHFLEIFVTPIYCKLHSNEPVTVYTSPEEWRNKIALDINIKQISGSPNSINPDDFNFYYNKTLEFNKKTYQLFPVKKIGSLILSFITKKTSQTYSKKKNIYITILLKIWLFLEKYLCRILWFFIISRRLYRRV